MDTQLPDWVPTQDDIKKEITIDLLLRTREEKIVASGRKMLVGEGVNAAGTLKLKSWEEHLSHWDGVMPGMPIRVTARVDKGFPDGAAPELNVKGIEILPANHPVTELMNPRYAGSVKELIDRWEAQVALLPAGHLTMIDAVMRGAGGWARFMTAPAASGHHHAYLHGLLEHTLEVTETAIGLASAQGIHPTEMANIRLGALLHDIGKVDEYAWEGVPISVSRAGNLRPHTLTGVGLVDDAFESLNEPGWTSQFSRDDLDILTTVIQQHHGRPEWTPSVAPHTMSAELVTVAEQAGRTLTLPETAGHERQSEVLAQIAHPGWRRVAEYALWHLRDVMRQRDAGDTSRPSVAQMQQLVLSLGQQPAWKDSINLDLAQAASLWRAAAWVPPADTVNVTRLSSKAYMIQEAARLWRRHGAELSELGLDSSARLQFEHACIAESAGLRGKSPVDQPGPTHPVSQLIHLADATSAWMRGRQSKMETGTLLPTGQIAAGGKYRETVEYDVGTGPRAAHHDPTARDTAAETPALASQPILFTTPAPTPDAVVATQPSSSTVEAAPALSLGSEIMVPLPEFAAHQSAILENWRHANRPERRR